MQHYWSTVLLSPLTVAQM